MPTGADKLGYTPAELDEANRKAVALLHDLKATFETDRSPMVISGCVGPRGDGYDPGTIMGVEEAEAYHARQISVFAQAEVDLVTAITMTNTNEAIGVTRAAQALGLPVVISFTVETDGRLPSGAKPEASHRNGRPCNRRRSGLFHDQLRPPDPFRA